MDDTIRRSDIRLLDVGSIDLYARRRYGRCQGTSLNGHYLTRLDVLRVDVTRDHVIAQHRLQFCGVLHYRIECARRKLLECFVGWRKDGEGTLSCQRIGQTRSLMLATKVMKLPAAIAVSTIFFDGLVWLLLPC